MPVQIVRKVVAQIDRAVAAEAIAEGAVDVLAAVAAADAEGAADVAAEAIAEGVADVLAAVAVVGTKLRLTLLAD